MRRRDFIAGALAATAAAPVIAGVQAEKSADQRPEPSEVERCSCPDEGLFAVRPHLQLLGEDSAAGVWVTKRPATGYVEWSQDDGATWTTDWTEEDGLRDAGSRVHRTVLTGFDPSKSVRFRACSRENPHVFAYAAVFKGEVEKSESVLNPIVPADGRVSFAMFNDVHNTLSTYPALLKHLDRPVNFTVFNGDIMNSVENEADMRKYLLAPLAYVCDRTHAAMWYLRGNHETRGGFSRRMRDFLSLPDGHYFGAVTLGAARIVFIDTGEDKPDGHREYSGIVDFDRYIARQRRWLEREFDSRAWRDAAFRIAVMHIPPKDVKMLGGGSWDGGSVRMRDFSSFLAGANISLALCAHLHRSANDDANASHPYPVVVGGGPGFVSEARRGKGFEATLTRCEYDSRELVVSQTNIIGEKLFERRIKPGGAA